MRVKCKTRPPLLKFLAQNAQTAGWQFWVTGLGAEEQLRVIS